MAKKLLICSGKSCKKNGSNKILKKWAKELIEKKKLKKTKKCKCLGICKKGFAVELKGKIYSCHTKEELKKVC